MYLFMYLFILVGLAYNQALAPTDFQKTKTATEVVEAQTPTEDQIQTTDEDKEDKKEKELCTQCNRELWFEGDQDLCWRCSLKVVGVFAGLAALFLILIKPKQKENNRNKATDILPSYAEFCFWAIISSCNRISSILNDKDYADSLQNNPILQKVPTGEQFTAQEIKQEVDQLTKIFSTYIHPDKNTNRSVDVQECITDAMAILNNIKDILKTTTPTEQLKERLCRLSAEELANLKKDHNTIIKIRTKLEKLIVKDKQTDINDNEDKPIEFKTSINDLD